VPLIVSAEGESAEDYVRVSEGLQEFGELVELNISSPNTELVYGWSTRPHELKDVFRAVRAATRKPIIVKVSPDFRETNEEVTIPAALDAGITIVNYGNTRRVEEPRLSQRSGGLSGPALFATTLENVRRARARFGDRLELTPPAASTPEGPPGLAAGATVRDLHRFITRGPLLPRRILDALPPREK
jgi:dihydroorotate dehydrogenase (NAD+) catalytic subunit